MGDKWYFLYYDFKDPRSKLWGIFDYKESAYFIKFRRKSCSKLRGMRSLVQFNEEQKSIKSVGKI